MSDDAITWKEKYLALLDQHEKLERHCHTQVELLKRGLIRSSLAAEGNDQQLDAQLLALRSLLRKETSSAELEAQIERLEKAVLKSEEKINQRKTAIKTVLTHFSSQLQQTQPAKEVMRELKTFEKGLPKKFEQPYNLYPLLYELQVLQQKALTLAAPNETPSSPGLFARLFKLNEPTADATLDQNNPELTQSQPEQEHIDSLDVAQSVATTQEALTAEADEDAYGLPHMIEPSYSSVAQHIHDTLIALLDDLPRNSPHAQHITLLRTRIDSGLNWYELAPLLDELAIIILDMTKGGNSELEQYLLQLNKRLVSFLDNLQATSDSYQASTADAQTLDHDLRQHVSSLHQDVQTAHDLNELKQRVETQLEHFVNSLQSYQTQRLHSESVLLTRLQTLAQHSQQMEAETQQLSIKLEEQRQKALLDPLTGLANRAALAERSELEQARIQRNHSSLLLSILDIDHFKRINDSYGHLAGDKVLKIIAQELKKRLRKTDFIARFGGEEYVILLPETPLAEGEKLLDSLRQSIEACPFHFKGEPVTITFSAGIGQVATHETLEQAIARIDQALYAAKKAGRNTIVTAPIEQPN